MNEKKELFYKLERLEKLEKLIKSESVTFLLMSAVLFPTASGVQDCSDKDYIELYYFCNGLKD